MPRTIAAKLRSRLLVLRPLRIRILRDCATLAADPPGADPSASAPADLSALKAGAAA